MFRKYVSIKNTFSSKEINYFLNKFPELENETYSITEKIHGCLIGESRILCSDGIQRKISDIVNKKIDIPVMGMDNEGNYTITKIKNWYRNGRESDWFRVKFARSKLGSGHSYGILTTTGNHKFYNPLFNKYIRCDKLRVGDSVLCSRTDIKLSCLQKQILIGKMLGGGYLANNSVVFGYKKEQEDYLQYTMDLLGYLAGSQQNDGVSGDGHKLCRARTISTPIISDMFKNWFFDNKKIIPKSVIITPVSLAFLYMDNGRLSHIENREDQVSFALCNFDETSIDNFINALKNLGIRARKNRQGKNYWRVSLTAENAHKMFFMISPYIVKKMQYKLPKYFRGFESISFKKQDAEFQKKFVSQKIISIEKIYGNHFKYDLETETNNYIANGIVVHNSNISLIFTKNGKFEVAKRTAILEKNEKFYEIQETIKKYKNLIEVFKEYAINSGIDITLFGEYFGRGIQKGVKYGEEKRILFFDIAINGRYVSQKEYLEIMVALGFSDLSVPEIAIVGSLKEALDYDINIDSTILGIENNQIEGIVIKVLNKVYVSGNGNIFYLKKKNDAFKQKKIVKKKKVVLKTSGLEKYRQDFLLYITKNRLEGIFSQYGEIVSLKDIGKYIGYMLKDAKKDFLSDSCLNLKKYSKKDVKYIFNVGGKIANMIKKYL